MALSRLIEERKEPSLVGALSLFSSPATGTTSPSSAKQVLVISSRPPPTCLYNTGESLDSVVIVIVQFQHDAVLPVWVNMGTAADLWVHAKVSRLRGVEGLDLRVLPEGVSLHLRVLVKLVIHHAQSHLEITIQEPIGLKVTGIEHGPLKWPPLLIVLPQRV